MQRGVAYKKLNQQVSLKHALHGQKSTKNEGVDRLSEQQCQKFDVLCSRFWPLSAFGGHFVQIAVLWGRAGCPLSGVERCPLLGGSEYTISMGRAIGGTEFVR